MDEDESALTPAWVIGNPALIATARDKKVGRRGSAATRL